MPSADVFVARRCHFGKVDATPLPLLSLLFATAISTVIDLLMLLLKVAMLRYPNVGVCLLVHRHKSC